MLDRHIFTCPELECSRTLEERAVLQTLQKRLEIIRGERRTVLARRAEYVRQDIQLRILLELIEEITMPHHQPEFPPNENDYARPCWDYEDFFRRTRYRIPENIYGTDGNMTKFNNHMAVRCLKNITVAEDGYRVNFKAGITVEIRR